MDKTPSQYGLVLLTDTHTMAELSFGSSRGGYPDEYEASSGALAIRSGTYLRLAPGQIITGTTRCRTRTATTAGKSPL